MGEIVLDGEETLTATGLGFSDVQVGEESDRILIYARWHGAPVAISQRGGLAGGFGVAFLRPAEDNAKFDEVVDITLAEPEMLLRLAAAALEATGVDRAEQYRGADLPKFVFAQPAPLFPDIT